MIDNPMVSIIIPVYNGSNYLREAIDSAIAQDYNNYEIIVVNDGSTDDGKTENIALSYSNTIRYYKKENGGVATALNYGISKMKGEYFSWLSHDDIYYPNKLSAQIEGLKQGNDKQAIVYSNYDVWDMDRGTISPTNFDKIYSEKQLTNSVFPVLQWLTLSCTPLVHKDHFSRVGLFDETLKTAQDNDMWFRLLRYGRSVFINESLLRSRIHKDSGTNTLDGFNEELGKVAVNSIFALSEVEMREVYKEPAIIYHRIAMILKGYNLPHYYDIVMKKFQEITLPIYAKDSLREFQEYINSFTDGRPKKICIFGAGHYGKRLFHDLNSRLIYVHCFLDNNPELWGKWVEGKPCISPEELQKEKDELLVIVAIQSSQIVIDELKKAGFFHVITNKELEWKISQTVPLKWITVLDQIAETNQFSVEEELVKNKLRQAIFDICKNYN